MQALDGPASLLTPLGYSSGSCGYCKHEDSSASYYARSAHLTVDHYQALVDRGWRRSGTVLYKPDVRRSCCPHYTIRLPAASFKPTRDQRQAVNRWNRFVLGDAYINEAKKKYPISKQEKAKKKNEFDLHEAVHEAEYEKLKTPPEPAHRFKVTLEPDDFTEEKFQLFSNYQQAVHHDKPSEISRKSFKNFLCNSPLVRRPLQESSSALGSFHQCYWLDDRLIAMAVIDLLPHAVSGVYFLYHSDYEKYSFGKLSALREAALAEELGLKYYYMGYYIHPCKKMRYKGEYRPQHVLDPETNEWNPLEPEISTLLDQKNYVSLSREKKRAAQASHMDVEDDAMDVEAKGMHLDSAAAAFDATQNGVSLFELGLPGMMTPRQLREQVDLDDIKIRVRGNMILPVAAFDLRGAITDAGSLPGVFAELAACVGPRVASQMVIKLD